MQASIEALSMHLANVINPDVARVHNENDFNMLTRIEMKGSALEIGKLWALPMGSGLMPLTQEKHMSFQTLTHFRLGWRGWVS
jgi:hypothetical protein